MLIKIVALLVPVGLDAFGVSAALAVAGLSRAQRNRTWLALTVSETAMPVAGILVGRPLAAIGNVVDYLAAAVLLVFAVRMLRDSADDVRALGARLQHGMLATVVLALSVGLDELAIGLALGVLRAPVAPVIAVIAIQSATISLLGLRLGERVGERWREGAERVAGGILALVAIGLLVQAVTRT
jgi:putative Mn2+ efflux pump MntP